MIVRFRVSLKVSVGSDNECLCFRVPAASQATWDPCVAASEASLFDGHKLIECDTAHRIVSELQQLGEELAACQHRVVQILHVQTRSR